MFSPIQQARYIDVSISEFQKHAFESFLALVMFLDISSTILWRCKLKSPQTGNLKEHNPFILKHNTHDLHDLYFPEGVFKCEGQKQY